MGDGGSERKSGTRREPGGQIHDRPAEAETLAMRRRLATQRKAEMVAGILELQDLPRGFNATVIDYPPVDDEESEPSASQPDIRTSRDLDDD